MSRHVTRKPIGSSFKVAPLGEARRPAGRCLVAGASSRSVTSHFQQMSPHGIQAMVLGETAIVVQRAEKLEPGLWSFHHRNRYGVVERDHRIGRDAFK